MNRKIFEWPSKKLSKVANPIVDFTTVEDIEKDLIDTCNINMGIGLAANQIGILKRVIIIKPSAFGAENKDPSKYNEEYMLLVNPKLEISDEKKKWREACLSLPMTDGGVERSRLCKVTYKNISGEEKTFEANWPFSAGLQHECDHLDGILYVNRMKRSNRFVTIEKLKRNKKKQNRVYKKRG